MYRTITAHTGEDYESGRCDRARGRNEPMPGVEPEPLRHEPERAAAAQPRRQAAINTLFQPRAREEPELVGAAGRERPKKQKETTTVNFQGRECEIIKGSTAAEDDEYIWIIGMKSGNKHYLCRLCGYDFHGHDSRIIAHYLRISGEGAKPCTRSIGQRYKDTLERARELKQAGKRAAASDRAVGRTPAMDAPNVMSSVQKKMGDVDKALVEWSVLHDIPEAALDGRSSAFNKVIQALLAAGPSYSLPAHAEVLFKPSAPTEGSRPGGLYLACGTMEREKAAVLDGAAETGGTLVSDGAKLSTRKRGMINTALQLPKGLSYVQQTDATGQVKNAAFLAKDLGCALEKCGDITQARVIEPPDLTPTPVPNPTPLAPNSGDPAEWRL